MRTLGFGTALSTAFAGMLAMHAAGCFDSRSECDLNPILRCGRWATTGTGSGGSNTGGTGGTAGTGGTGGTISAGCIPNENVDAVGDTCGVFVSSSLGDDANAGMKNAPLKSLAAALAKAKGQPVYACGESFAESVSISADATLYGALDCANGWKYDAAKKTQLMGDADAVALTISTAPASVQVFDFAITSANATKDGGSSIAVLVAQATASFMRCDLVAGDGKAGLVGAPFTSVAQGGSDGLTGSDACTANIVVGADSVTNMCGDGDSISGIGGNGTTNSGGTGSPGEPQGAMNGGNGEGAMACTDGAKGDDGGPGNPGLGATGTGTIAASGYTGANGGEGTPGHVAQGGGGGGGAKGGTGAGKCPAGMTGGASGGSGGSGGCGGLGGKGGAFGGSSIALVSIDATLSFTSVTLKAGSGGNGGDGGDGQSGGGGGMPGPAGGGVSAGFNNLNDACAGGPGGNGGPGGKGGGGTGGHSLPIAAMGKAVPMTGWTATKGTAGTGGKGDNANGNPGDGAEGKAADCWDFGTSAACK